MIARSARGAPKPCTEHPPILCRLTHVADRTIVLAARRLSSDGQSNALVMRRSRVRIPKAALWKPQDSLAVTWGFCFYRIRRRRRARAARLPAVSVLVSVEGSGWGMKWSPIRRMASFERCDLPFTYRRVWLICVCRRISMIVGMSTPQLVQDRAHCVATSVVEATVTDARFRQKLLKLLPVVTGVDGAAIGPGEHGAARPDLPACGHGCTPLKRRYAPMPECLTTASGHSMRPWRPFRPAPMIETRTW